MSNRFFAAFTAALAIDQAAFVTHDQPERIPFARPEAMFEPAVYSRLFALEKVFEMAVFSSDALDVADEYVELMPFRRPLTRAEPFDCRNEEASDHFCEIAVFNSCIRVVTWE